MQGEEGPDPLDSNDIGEFVSVGTMEVLHILAWTLDLENDQVLIKDEGTEKDNCVDEDPLHRLDPLVQEKLGKNTKSQTRPRAQCQECGKEISCKYYLKKHMAIHDSGRRKYRCNWPGCGKTFLHSDSVKRHEVLIHHDTGRQMNIFNCGWPGCPKTFSQKGNVRKHMVVHTGERPHKCPEEGCNKAFGRRFLLGKHLATHSREKPFKCLELNCGKLFSHKFSLDRHKLMHSGEKPYKCMELGCDKAFKYIGMFKTHRKRHHEITIIAVQEEMFIMNEAVKEEDVVCGEKKKCFEKAQVKQEAVLEEEEVVIKKEYLIKEESVIKEELVIKEEVIIKGEVVIEEVATEETVLEGIFW